MALLFMDGFDYYSTDGNEGAVGAGWDASPTPGVGNTSSGIYGYGKYSNNLTAYRTIPNTQTVILGFHYFPGGSLEIIRQTGSPSTTESLLKPFYASGIRASSFSIVGMAPCCWPLDQSIIYGPTPGCG